MTRALLSISHGEYDQLLALSGPRFSIYASKFDYDLHLLKGLTPPEGRSEPWNKIAHLIQMLEVYDEVLLLDCDVIVMNYEPFPWDEIRASGANHALVVHRMPLDGVVPNTGVLGVTKDALPMLQEVWDWPLTHAGEFTTAAWWDQSAYMQLTGYDARVRPCTDAGVAVAEWGQYPLPQEWNVLKDNDKLMKSAIIRHASGVGNTFPMKVALMKKWLGQPFDTNALQGAGRIIN